MVVLLVFVQLVACCFAYAGSIKCNLDHLKGGFSILQEDLKSQIQPTTFRGSSVELRVQSKSNFVSFYAYCRDGLWHFNNISNTTSIQKKYQHKRKKRFIGLLILGLVCLFGGCSKPKPRDNVPPMFENCPIDIFEEAMPYKLYTFVNWVEPSAWDSVDGNVRVTREGRRPGAPFHEGRTRIGYVAKDRSGNMNTCAFFVHVKVVRCPVLSSRIKDGYRVCHLSSDMVKGTTCRYGCYEGHELKGGPPRKECLSTGKWSCRGEPYCQKKSCASLLVPPQGPLLMTCSDKFFFRSLCSYQCREGFDIPKYIQRTKVCLANGIWDGDNPYCHDITAPVIHDCPHTLIFFPDDNRDDASVHWKVPQVSDNKDSNLRASQKSGPSSGSLTKVGTYTVTYEVKDLAGNSAECSFQVVVKQLRCRRLYPLPYMTLNCTGTRRGSSCSFFCDTNSELNGTRQAYCSKVYERPYAEWGMETIPFCQVEEACPEIIPPMNGAMACDVWLGGRLCHPSCREGFSVLMSNPLPDLLVCTEDGEWLYYDKVTDCIAKQGSRRRLAVMSAEFYFSGDCNDPAVQVEIKENFIKTLRGSRSWSEKCNTNCRIDNVQVVCGASSLKIKRSTTNMKLEFSLVFGSSENKILSSDQYESEVKLLNDIMADLETEFDNMTNSNISFNSISSSSLNVECTDNSLPEYGADVGCVPCPIGTFYDSSKKTCTKCARGSYQPLTSQSSCIRCPLHQSTQHIGATNASECEDACGPGTWSSTGLPPCVECDIGSYEDSYGSVECKKCSGTKITETEGSDNVSSCLDFDIVFPNTMNDSSVILEDSRISLNSPFLLSMHVKSESNNGTILSLQDSQTDITLSTTDVTINNKIHELPVEVNLTKKWHHLLLLFSENGTELRIDGTNMFIDNDPVRSFANYTVILGGDGFVGSVSQFLAIQQDQNTTDLTSYSTCFHEKLPDGIVLNWVDFSFSRLLNSYIDFPSKCDDIDGCLSNPCLHGVCNDILDGYECSCQEGFEGVNCDDNIDDCLAHACQNNASCVDGITEYTCNCSSEYTGKLCEIKMVDGHWSRWDNWTDCSVSCGNGTRRRARSCSNPLPDNGGQMCEGNNTEYEECILEPCRECFDLVATNHSTLTCTNTSNMIICIHVCDEGYWFDKDVRADYRCGNETYYYWDFQTEDNPYARLPYCSEIFEPRNITVDYNALYDESLCNEDVKQIIIETWSNYLNILQCGNDSKCNYDHLGVRNCDTNERVKRDSSSNGVGVTFTLSCNSSDYGIADCSQTLSAVTKKVQSLERESKFDFNHSSIPYQILQNSSSSESRLDCPAGSIAYILICVKCSVGHFEYSGECNPCPRGSYQDLPGETSCEKCPEQLTTAGLASVSIDDCSVFLKPTDDFNYPLVFGIVCGIVLALVFISILCIRHKKRTKTFSIGTDVVPDKTNKKDMDMKELIVTKRFNKLCDHEPSQQKDAGTSKCADQTKSLDSLNQSGNGKE